MTDHDFSVISGYAYKYTGIKLSHHKMEMVYSRLSRRLRKLGLGCFKEYCNYLTQSPGEEKQDFINAITTNLTAFFREKHHFEYLTEAIVPLLKTRNRLKRRIRIWSAGCSTGQEPYSIAMQLDKGGFGQGWDVRILATDLDSNVLAKAQSGIYPVEQIENLPAQKRRYFSRDERDGNVRIATKIKEKICFKELNLLGQWPMKGPLDIIFCRNVIIYFDKQTQEKLFQRFNRILAPGGYLFLGHSETMPKLRRGYRHIYRTIYQKWGDDSAGDV